ncbi:MAG: hypothetical protein ABR555_08200 [Pyrinomonadaceae bacterium]
MEVITGIFNSREAAEAGIQQLQSAGIASDRIGLLTPGMSNKEVESTVPTTDTEDSGMGKTMGGAVGGALGVAGGASLGVAAASLALPGVGPILAFGLVGAALLGAGGAATGAVVGETIEENLGEGLPHEELFVYEDVLRRGRSVVVAFIDDEEQSDAAHRIVQAAGGEDINSARDNWWQGIREKERGHYQTNGRDFARDEQNYRRGFEAALQTKRRGKSYTDVEQNLREYHDEGELDEAFRAGYERGLAYQATIVEIHKD